MDLRRPRADRGAGRPIDVTMGRERCPIRSERLCGRSSRVIRALAAIAVLCVAAACTSTLVDYSAAVHVVQPGETLYSIAWRHGLDYHELARWNGLSNPDRLFVGQRLRLQPTQTTAAAGRAAPPPAVSAPRQSAPPRPSALPPPPSVPGSPTASISAAVQDRTSVPRQPVASSMRAAVCRPTGSS
jgi:LysM repeat protein